ncbi:MAG: hypothetical protein IJV26_11215 [Lachnospiraceae bacterium]|nr:hypothetical protein [Lachnospiraceae bacterium]
MKNRFTVNQTSKCRGLPMTALLLAASLAIAGGLYAGMRLSADNISTDTLLREKESIERAMERDITACYALEGMYPPDLTYIREHYGLTYPESRFYVDYRPIAANIRPDYAVILLRQEEGGKGE